MQPNERDKREETDEEFLARLAARRAKRLEASKPRLTLNVSPRIVEAVKADPDSVGLVDPKPLGLPPGQDVIGRLVNAALPHGRESKAK
jgi:hypothetical protein